MIVPVCTAEGPICSIPVANPVALGLPKVEAIVTTCCLASTISLPPCIGGCGSLQPHERRRALTFEGGDVPGLSPGRHPVSYLRKLGRVA